ncbi:transposase [Haloferula chungangensis]|uniref:Transposase n=1 Tax=Haloferula chungangensis TaxID=1048331 RepID=A0ABW2L5T5_9BACT
MGRGPRIEFPGAIYHVLARGNRREAIVLGDDDRWMFLRTLGEMAKRTGIRIHAYALMDNHYHLVLETPKANLVAGMQWFQTTYTRRFNVKNAKQKRCQVINLAFHLAPGYGFQYGERAAN